MGTLLALAGLELLVFGGLEYFLATRRSWWKLTALLPLLGAFWFRAQREAEWWALSVENRAKFGLMRWLEQRFFILWLVGIAAGLVIAVYRGRKKKAKQGEERS